MGCSSESGGDVGGSAAAVSAGGRPADAITDFECTSVASSTTDAHLKSTRLDVTIDVAPTGVPSGILGTGFEASLHASFAVGFGVSHVRDTTASGQAVSEYKIDFGADSILKGATGGTLTIPTAYTKMKLENSPALNVATLKLTPSNTTVTYKCKQDKRKSPAGPVADPGPVFQGSAKDVVAKDPCAKTVAQAVMDNLIDGLENAGVDIPDSFVFTKIDKTDSGFKTVVNGRTVSVVVAAGCNIKSIDNTDAVPSSE
jgi:hypothetical protein